MDPIIESKPRVSILLPVYNCERYIRQAVSSILEQDYQNYELLIIDDASTDKTVSIIQEFQDPRINLILKETNVGYSKNLNEGLGIAAGEYIARMDGDDISMPTRLSTQVAFLDANPEVIVCGTSFQIMGNTSLQRMPEMHEEIKLRLLRENCIAHPTVMIRKKAIEEFSIKYDPSREPSEDYDLWVKLLKVGKLHNLQESLFKYRMHNSSVSRQRSEEQERNSVESRIELLKTGGIILTDEERLLMFKIYSKKESLGLEEVKSFDKLRLKLENSNGKGFFDPEGFKHFIKFLELEVLKSFTFRYTRYNPKIFLDYLKCKRLIKVSLPVGKEIELFVKSMIFWKI